MIDDIHMRYGGSRNQAATLETTPPASGATAPVPEFIRLPKPGRRCPWTGLTRSSMNQLVLGPEAPVKSVVVARKGASRGVRLVVFASLISYLNGLMDSQARGREGSDE